MLHVCTEIVTVPKWIICTIVGYVPKMYQSSMYRNGLPLFPGPPLIWGWARGFYQELYEIIYVHA